MLRLAAFSRSNHLRTLRQIRYAGQSVLDNPRDASLLQTFSTVNEGKNALRSSCGNLSEKEAMAAFRRLYAFAVEDLRKSPHLITAGFVSTEMTYAVQKLLQSHLTHQNIAVIIEGMSRLEIPCHEYLSKNFNPELVVTILQHCCDRDVHSLALVSSTVLALISNMKHLGDGEVLQCLPLICAVNYRGDMPELGLLAKRLQVRFQLKAVRLEAVPVLAQFYSLAGLGSTDLMEAYQAQLMVRPDLLLPIVTKIQPYHTLPIFQQTLLTTMSSDLARYSVGDVADVMRAVGTKNLSADVQLQFVQYVLARAEQLKPRQLPQLMVTAGQLKGVGLPKDQLLACLSYACLHIESFTARDLCKALEFALLTQSTVDNFVKLVCLEVVHRISSERQPSSAFLFLLKLVDMNSSYLDKVTHSTSLITELLLAQPDRPEWVQNSIGEFLSQKHDDDFIQRIYSRVGVDRLCQLSTSFLMQICTRAAGGSSSLLAKPFVTELANRVDQVDTALDLLMLLSSHAQALPGDPLFEKVMERLMSLPHSDSKENPKKWVGLVVALRGTKYADQVGQHIVQMIQATPSTWPATLVLDTIVSFASANIHCYPIVQVLMDMPDAGAALNEMSMAQVANLAFFCGQLGFTPPSAFLEPLLADEYGLGSRVALLWSKLAAGSSDLSDARSFLRTLTIEDVDGAAIRGLQCLLQIYYHVLAETSGSGVDVMPTGVTKVVVENTTRAYLAEKTGMSMKFSHYVQKRFGKASMLCNGLLPGGAPLGFAVQLDNKRQVVPWIDDENASAGGPPSSLPVVHRMVIKDSVQLVGIVPQALPANTKVVRRLAVVLLDQRLHCLAGSKKLVGDMLLYIHLLEKLGWDVIKITDTSLERLYLLGKGDDSITLPRWLAVGQKESGY